MRQPLSSHAGAAWSMACGLRQRAAPFQRLALVERLLLPYCTPPPTDKANAENKRVLVYCMTGISRWAAWGLCLRHACLHPNALGARKERSST